MVDRDHEGYNGYAVAQVGEVASPAIDAYSPDLVVLLAGTNDQIEFVPPSQPPADAAADFEALIEGLDMQQPGIQIVAGQVIPLTYNDEGVSEYNALLPAIIARQQERGVNVRLVDHYAIGESSLSTDGIHPTQTGYDAMADIWLPAVLEAIDEL
jgi:lysophospholipase L1-like esterase